MASAHDVAAYILEQRGSMSTFKLQKLLYYSQAWHLAWEETALFADRIEAWANGPVVRSIFNDHRGQFSVDPGHFGARQPLAENERETVDIVLRDYGELTGRQLSHLTHSERPWRDARGDLPSTATSSAVIPPAALQEFYSALDADPAAPQVDSINLDDAQ